jgi:hypothetical protein
MATSKRKASGSAAAKTTGKGPFKTKRSTETVKHAENVLTPPPEVAEAVDAFRTAQDQAKYYEGEATVHKNTVSAYAAEEYAKRLYSGDDSGFKVQGVETMAMYVVQDSSAGLSEEDADDFAKRWGQKAAEELITRDFGSIRFNETVLEANYDAVVKALEKLPAEVLENLFKPMALKARKHAAQNARKHVKNATELREILRHLKLKQYVR